MTDRFFLSILLAAIVEASHWLRTRWDFDDVAFGRAWSLTVVFTGITALLVFLDSNLHVALPRVLTWLPVLLLPLQFVQAYGFQNSLPLNTFSFLAKQRRERNLKLGLSASVLRINFGNVFFIATIIAATLGKQSDTWQFLPSLLVLTGWLLLSSMQSRRAYLWIALAAAGVIAVGGTIGLKKIGDWYGDGQTDSSAFSPAFVNTQIGRPGEVIQSQDIVWRLKPQNGNATPRLLRTANYFKYGGGTWANARAADRAFDDLDTRIVNGQSYYLLARDASEASQLKATSEILPRFNIRGSVFPATPLPLPADSGSLRDFVLDGIERNVLGTVRVFPKESIMEGTILWQSEAVLDRPVVSYEDLQIPTSELAVLMEISKEIGLTGQQSLHDKLTILRAWFVKNYKYSRNLTIRYNANSGSSHPTAIAQFLTTERVGHCEYFATAAALLMRANGIPTRYTIGYSAVEKDPKRGEFVIRGTHGHAWCRVWDQDKNRWLDFDPTPDEWIGMVAKKMSLSQQISDQLKRWKEDFFLWRNRPDNVAAGRWIILSIVGIIVLYLGKRLWKSKRQVASVKYTSSYGGPSVLTPLHAIEPTVAKFLGKRLPGQTYAAWLLTLKPSLGDVNLIEQAIQIHQRLRFDPAGDQGDETEQLRKLTDDISRELADLNTRPRTK